MKVLMLAPWKAAIVQRLVAALEDQGIEVILASHNAQGEQGIEDLGPIKSLFSYFQRTKVHQLIETHKPDVIHAHMATHYGVMASLQNKVPYVLALWGSEVMMSPFQGAWVKRTFFHLLVKHTVKRAAICHSSSVHVCEQAADIAGCSMEKFKSFFWGIIPDTILAQPQSITIKKWESCYPQLKNKKFILSGRGVRSIYQPEEVAQMIIKFGKVVSQKGHIFVVLRGYSADTDADVFLQKLKGLGDYFVFIDQILNEEDLGYFYHQSVLHISIPLSDSLGGGVVEPAMCGSYPVLSDLPGNRWFAKNYFGSLLEEDYNIIKLIKKINDEEWSLQVGKVKADMRGYAVTKNVTMMYEEACRSEV